MTLQELTNRAGHLPASQIACSVNQALAEHDSLVITAPPGAGKSTLLPLTMLMGIRPKGKILMLEPRRVATLQIAERMAHILDEPVGKTVGYRIRFESKISKDTRIEVITEGILTRMLIDDATLDGIDLVIFDEFHERSLNSDLALALTHQTQQILRTDLRLVVMSATIETETICHSLHAPLIKSEGKMFPVKIIYAEQDIEPLDLVRTTASIILEAHRLYPGDILAFLPGVNEIQRCEQLLLSSPDVLTSEQVTTQIYPLYGNLSPEVQRRAIAPSHKGERKIVLATPIAETSITIEGVRIVVDSGFYRKVVFDAKTGLSHMETMRISRDMATQRTGRAGRVAEGVCYRLWTQISEHQMTEQRKPEIEEADLSAMLLDTTAFGESNAMQLPWLTPPPTNNIMQAKKLLLSLGAIGEQTSNTPSPIITITPRGNKMASLPCHPRIASMIISGNTQAMKSLACDVAALLEEKDPLSSEENADISLRISILRSCRRKKNLGKWARIAKIAQEYLLMAHAIEDNNTFAAEDIGQLLAHAYPERIALSMDNIGNFRLANGSQAKLPEADDMSAHKWIVIASLYSFGKIGKAFLVAPLDIDSITNLIVLHDNIQWDNKQGCIVMQREKRIGKLVVESKPIHNADVQQIVNIVCEAIKKEGLSMLDWNEKVQLLQRRVALVAEWHPELGIPDLSTIHLMTTAQEWLPYYIVQGEHVKANVSELKKIDLAEVLWNIVPYDLQQEIDKLAPTHIQVPTGSRIRIDYRQGAEAPILSVRLQECFGMQQTPCIDNGRRPLLMELLSPGFKPVQLTQDLHSFWSNTYFEVRKELKRRYPKHEWPEDPTNAKAVRGVKKR